MIKIRPQYFIVIVFCLIECEIVLYMANFPAWWQTHALRDFRFAQFDQSLGWRCSPGVNVLAENNRVFTVTTWDGSRRATREKSTKDGPRAILLGDSFMQGYGIDDKETIGWLLQKQFPQINVENYACGGYGIPQIYTQIKEANELIGGIAPYIIYLLIPDQLNRTVGHPANLRNYVSSSREFSRIYAELNNSGEIEIKKSQGIDIWPTSFYFRTSMLIEEIVERILFYSRTRNRDEVSFKLLRNIGEVVFAEKSKFMVVLVDFEKKDSQKFIDTFYHTNVKILDCSNPQYKEQKYRISDGHPNGLMNAKLSACIAEGLKQSLASEG